MRRRKPKKNIKDVITAFERKFPAYAKLIRSDVKPNFKTLKLKKIQDDDIVLIKYKFSKEFDLDIDLLKQNIIVEFREAGFKNEIIILRDDIKLKSLSNKELIKMGLKKVKRKVKFVKDEDEN